MGLIGAVDKFGCGVLLLQLPSQISAPAEGVAMNEILIAFVLGMFAEWLLIWSLVKTLYTGHG